ncbi:TPA: PerC family transcriptional regulator [Escherichia coli]
MGKYHWKVEKQPEWYVKAVRKTIAALPGGYAEAADWLDVTENALFNRLRADGDQIFPLGWAMVLQRAAVGTNDPRVILCLTRQAEELESRGLYRRAATVWMAAFRESHSQPERNNFLARRERCLRKSSKRAASGEEWYLSGNYVGA